MTINIVVPPAPHLSIIDLFFGRDLQMSKSFASSITTDQGDTKKIYRNDCRQASIHQKLSTEKQKKTGNKYTSKTELKEGVIFHRRKPTAPTATENRTPQTDVRNCRAPLPCDPSATHSSYATSMSTTNAWASALPEPSTPYECGFTTGVSHPSEVKCSNPTVEVELNAGAILVDVDVDSEKVDVAPLAYRAVRLRSAWRM